MDEFKVIKGNDLGRIVERDIFNRLCSIRDDSLRISHWIEKLKTSTNHENSPFSTKSRIPFAIRFGNRRCGSWYTLSHDSVSNTYSRSLDWTHFKSTDGHSAYNLGTFSLSRLNLQLIQSLGNPLTRHSAVIIDATRRGKICPDSLTRTLPVFLSVIDCLRVEFSLLDSKFAQESILMKKFPQCVSQSELSQIFAWIPKWKHDLISSIGRERLLNWLKSELESVQGPILIDWLSSNGNALWNSMDDEEIHQFMLDAQLELHKVPFVYAISASNVVQSHHQTHIASGICTCTPFDTSAGCDQDESDSSSLSEECDVSEEESECGFDLEFVREDEEIELNQQCECGARWSYEYIQGAADDEETWSHGLEDWMFWKHYKEILLNPQECVAKCRQIVNLYKNLNDLSNCLSVLDSVKTQFHSVFNSKLYIGSWHNLLTDLCEEFDEIVVVGYRIPIGLIQLWRERVSNECVSLHVCELIDKRGRMDRKYGLLNRFHEIVPLFRSESHQKMAIFCENGEDLCVTSALAIVLTSYGNFSLTKTDFGAESRQNLDKSTVRSVLYRLSLEYPFANPSRTSLQQLNQFLFRGQSIERRTQ